MGEAHCAGFDDKIGAWQEERSASKTGAERLRVQQPLSAAGPSSSYAFPDDGRERRMVTGVVFKDLSGTPLRRASDPGIAGVLVSNGSALSGPTAKGDIDCLSTTKPSYCDQAERDAATTGAGSHGIDPTGELPDSVDFALRKADEPDRFDVILFTGPCGQRCGNRLHSHGRCEWINRKRAPHSV